MPVRTPCPTHRVVPNGSASSVCADTDKFEHTNEHAEVVPTVSDKYGGTFRGS